MPHSRDEARTPDPDDPRKPDAPTDLDKPSWKYVVRKAVLWVQERLRDRRRRAGTKMWALVLVTGNELVLEVPVCDGAAAAVALKAWMETVPLGVAAKRTPELVVRVGQAESLGGCHGMSG